MGIDRSYYSLKNEVNSEIILGFVSDVFKSIIDPELRVTIRSSSKEIILQVKDTFNWNFISCALSFKTDKVTVAKREILKYNDILNSLSIGMQHVIDDLTFSIRLNYSKQLKETKAYLSLPVALKEVTISELSIFLNSINDYNEFGIESIEEITQFAETLYSLNSQSRSTQDKWLFETGCITFETDNYHINRELEKKRNFISGLNVKFSKIHALAYKAKGILELSKILKQDFGIKKLEYILNFSDKEILSLIQSIPMKEINCLQYYSTKSLDIFSEIEWLIKDNDCNIELNNCKFHQNDKFDFNISINGNSLDSLNVDLGIEYLAPKEYKTKVLKIFKGYMKYDGDS